MINKTILLFVGSFLINCTSSKKTVHNTMYESFGIVYSKITLGEVEGYDLLIVEPYFYSKDEVATFQAKGIKVVAYLSLGEVNESRKYFEEFKKIGFKGKNENHGSYYTDLTNSKIKDTFIYKIVPELLSYGYDGLFLDTIDAVSPYTIRREMKGDMVELVKSISQRNPSTILIQNAGFFILEETSKIVTAIAVEDVASGYNFETDEYLVKSEQKFQERIEFINNLHQTYNIPFLIIDFAENSATEQVVAERLEKTKFPYFISNIGFKGLPSRKAKYMQIKEGV